MKICKLKRDEDSKKLKKEISNAEKEIKKFKNDSLKKLSLFRKILCQI